MGEVTINITVFHLVTFQQGRGIILKMNEYEEVVRDNLGQALQSLFSWQHVYLTSISFYNVYSLMWL